MHNLHACLYWQSTSVGQPRNNEVSKMRIIFALPLLALATVSACTGSPATLAMRPDFQVATSAGPAEVCIRETPPGMTFSEFDRIVKDGMVSVTPAITQTDSAAASVPARRFVWHVDPMPARGVWRLAANAFDESTPIVYEQEVMDSSASPGVIAGTVRSMTQRLVTALHQGTQVG